MPYCIVELLHAAFPTASSASAVLDDLGLPESELLSAFRTYVCNADLSSDRGFQMDVASDLEIYLQRALARDGLRPTRSRHDLKYSLLLNQHADFGLVHEASRKRILFEIEFRPNYEKDLVKFQIGFNTGRLALAVMIVAIDRKSINPRYTTMPEFSAVTKVLSELKPSYPLLVIGLRGNHAA